MKHYQAAANLPRQKTDALFSIPETNIRLTGYPDALIRLIEKIQLKDTDLWRRVINQFRSNVDDHDVGWRSEYFGKLMRGGCFVWSYTRDEELYKVLTDAIESMLTTQDDLGRFTSYSLEAEFDGWDLWGRKYVMLGFQYYLEICRDEALAQRLIAAMVRHADYIIGKIGNTEGKKNITLCTRHWDGVNSSSILEPFVRLYSLTGEARYLDFAKYIVENGGVETGDLITLAYEGVLYPYQYPVTKAYEMMSFFEGVLEYYRITGIEKYRVAVENFINRIIESDITVIGCSGTTHELFDNSAVHQTDPEMTQVMQETCVTVTWMKLCLQVLCLTGRADLAEHIEVSAYNALFGSVNTDDATIIRGMNHDAVTVWGGFPFDSYSPLLANKRGRGIGGFKVMQDGTAYGCCAAIGACGMGIVPKATCLQRRDGVALTMYHDSVIDTQIPDGSAVRLTVQGGYPVNGKITIGVSPAVPAEFTLALRIPSWSGDASLTVNGTAVQVQAGTFAEIKRIWSAGDQVELNLPMHTRMLTQNGYCAFVRGPLTLARDARIGEDIHQPLDPALDDQGYVVTRPSHNAPFKTEFEETIVLKDGSGVTFVDYASAGKTWELDSMMAAWLPLA